MEIEIKQDKLNKALAIVSRVATGRSTLPILSNVMIKAEDKKVSLTATNLDMAVVDYVPVISSKDGVVTVPAKLLAEFVNNLPRDEVIKLTVDGVKLKIKAGKYTSTINGALADEFPELPELDEKKMVVYKMAADEFKLGLSEVILGASNDTTRPGLTGVYFNTSDGVLYIAATDGYRLIDKKFIGKVESEVKAIVPTGALQEVLRSLSDDIDEIEMIFEENQVRFRLGEVEITSNLIDGLFPDYRKLMPEKIESEVILDKSELTRVVKMARVFSRGANGAIICKADADKNIFSVSSIVNEAGENSSEIEVKIPSSFEIKVDGRYLTDALGVIESKNVRFEFAGKNSPIVLKNEKSDDYNHVIMPLMI